MIVNLGFKSGTNDPSMAAPTPMAATTRLNARNPFATQKPGTDLEQFGMSLGGPIKKNKIFFFGGYEGKRVTSSTTQVGLTEPTTANPSRATPPQRQFPCRYRLPLESQGFCNPVAAGGLRALTPISLYEREPGGLHPACQV